VTPEQAAANAKPGLATIVGAFAESPQTLRRARLLGLSGWAYHVSARAGALGEVRPETVAATIGFIAPDAVADAWEAATKATDPLEVATWHLHELCRWGGDQLGGFPRLNRLVDLSKRVVAGVDGAALPLFAAWRAMPLPDDSPGARAAVLAHLLREHRGAAHLLAIRASGLSPLEAIISGPEGEAGATAFGWQPPFPPFEPLVRRRSWAEALTDRIAGEAFRALAPTERVELVNLLDAAVTTVREAAPA